ncbi:hypothetical protein V3H18_04810 [Methylocystis sp. 9N]|uniref:Transmembrane protein n=1 Tax=Methylocystis borbori TaxID=3118750 RepID=A0ABU7XEP5_9HYPH
MNDEQAPRLQSLFVALVGATLFGATVGLLLATYVGVCKWSKPMSTPNSFPSQSAQEVARSPGRPSDDNRSN